MKSFSLANLPDNVESITVITKGGRSYRGTRALLYSSAEVEQIRVIVEGVGSTESTIIPYSEIEAVRWVTKN